MNETEIIDQLIFDIQANKYNLNDKLPSENELADRYKVPRITVRKAYERLQEMGYIYSKQGIGRFLKNRQRQINLVLSGDVSFSKKMEDMGYKFESQNIFCEEIDYDEKIFNFLGVDKSDRVFKIGRLRIIDDKPLALHISHVAKSVFNDIDKVGKNIKSMFAYYNSKGYCEFYSNKSILSVSFPTKYERQILDCSNLIPLLILISGCIDKKTNRVLEYTKILYRTDYFKYVIQ
ncbi:MAG: GntR family transcriptional regulator [Epulopiscium sp.]|jgi:GntR family transcriptional regulator|nr:GntR family transcriptional regulator [Candidatus Epulonipiscium sp.]MDK2824474.1 GntR family transcriptional regulator [Clostridia bacterium]MDN5322830.1 GntR family transcriptional regulator [Clostridia bacterium]